MTTLEEARSASAIDDLAELVAQRYPKGTSDPYGKALRHQLHKLGRLNDPEPLAPVLEAQARALLAASRCRAEDFESGAFTAEDIRAWQMRLATQVWDVLHRGTSSGLYETMPDGLTACRPPAK